MLVVPGASRQEVSGEHDKRLRIRVTTPPERGRANKEVAKLLSELFGAPARLLGGGSGRRQIFLLEGRTPAQVQRILQELITLPQER